MVNLTCVGLRVGRQGMFKNLVLLWRVFIHWKMVESWLNWNKWWASKSLKVLLSSIIHSWIWTKEPSLHFTPGLQSAACSMCFKLTAVLSLFCDHRYSCYSLYEAYLFLFRFSGKRGSVGSVGSSLNYSGTIARVNMFLFINWGTHGSCKARISSRELIRLEGLSFPDSTSACWILDGNTCHQRAK